MIVVFFFCITGIICAAQRTNEIANRDRNDGEWWIGAPSRADNNYSSADLYHPGLVVGEDDKEDILDNNHSSIYHQGIIFGQDHKKDIPDGHYFYQPYAEYDDWVEPRKNNTKNEIKAIPQISVYSRSKRQRITYQVLHTFWANGSANAYSVKKFKMAKNKPPIVNAVMKIFWTMDEKNMADNIRLIMVREHYRQRLPRWPVFVDATRALNREDRLRIIRSTLQEAFDYWSSILFNRVIFEYVSYDSRLKNSRYFDRVVTIGMKDMIHLDEHTNLTDIFSSKAVLAHASINLVHFNREAVGFYIAPHLTSKRVYIAVEDNSNANWGKTTLYEISGKALAKRYRIKNYKDLYRRSKAFFEGRLLYKGNQQLNCMVCVAIHEIGHVMGLGHTDERDSVMFGVYTTNEVIHNNDDKTVLRKFYAGLLDRIKHIEKQNLLLKCSQKEITIS